MANGVGNEPRVRGLGWLPWVALAVLWFATLQVRPMFDPDEGRYAEIPREMVASGDWVTPRLNGLKYFEKPVLQYWATSSVYSVFGLSEWTSRLWTVGLGFACLPMVFGWTARLYGRWAGVVAVTALALSPYFGIVGHLDLLDAGFTFWLTAAVFAFTLAQCAQVGSASERRWMLIAWATAALAVLSKGIVVGVLAGAALFLYSVLERDLRVWRRLHWLLGVPLFLVVAAPWFVAVTLRNPDFPGFFFVHEHFERFLTTVHQRVEPWWFFLPFVVLGVLPWVGVAVRACREAWQDDTGCGLRSLGAQPGPPAADARSAVASNPQFKPRKFLLIFAAVTLVFFSASGSKLAPYVLPMLPPLAAIAGAYLAARPESGRAFVRVAARSAAGLILFLAVGLLGYSWQVNGFVPSATYIWAVVSALPAIVAVLVTTRFWGESEAVPGTDRPSGPSQSWGPARLAYEWAAGLASLEGRALVTAGAAILAWQTLLCEISVIPPARSARDLVSAVRPFIHPDTELYSVGQYRETVSPYLGRLLTLVSYEGELQFGLNAEPGRQKATPDDFVARWKASTNAVAFFDPGVWESYHQHGLPGRVIAGDHYTVAVSRL